MCSWYSTVTRTACCLPRFLLFLTGFHFLLRAVLVSFCLLHCSVFSLLPSAISARGFLLALFLAFSISHLLQPCLLLPLQSCSAKHREIAKHPPIRQEQPRARLSTPCYTARPRNSIQTKATLRTHSYSEDRSYSGGKKPHVKLCDYFDCYWRAWSCCCC